MARSTVNAGGRVFFLYLALSLPTLLRTVSIAPTHS
jgi:hypothetical protein